MGQILKKRVLKVTGNIKIKEKLLLSFLLIGIIPLIISTFLTYDRSINILESNMTQMTTQALEQANVNISSKIESVISATDMLMQNYDISEALFQEPADYDIGIQYEDMKKLQIYLKSLQNSQKVYRVRLFVKSGLLYSNEDFNFFDSNSVKEQEWYKETLKASGAVYWQPAYNAHYLGEAEDIRVVTASRTIVNYRRTGEFVAVACVDILQKDLNTILKNSPVAQGGIICLLDQKGNIISSSDEQLWGEKYKNININDLPQREALWKNIAVDGRQELVAVKEVRETGWKLVAFIPLQKIIEPSIRLRNYTLGSIAVTGIIAYLLAFFISFLITRRINRLMGSMRKAERGDLETFVDIGGTDEIGELEGNFNRMLTRISGLMDERYRLGQELKNAELRTLQAQINPHFLYNTLDLIGWKASRNKPGDVKELVYSLAKFYKLSLSNGKEVISIQDEIAHIQAYIDIQNKRFDNNIILTVNLEEGVEKFSILKLVLQPIVENAILHGIMEREDQKGEIRISGRCASGEICLELADDGIGMEQEVVGNILAGELGEQGHGFGIKNVEQRLKIFYGESYGLTYYSVKGQGTTVKVVFPAAPI